MRKLNRGQELTATELNEITEHLILSQHAKQRIAERYPELNVHKAILNPLLAYFNTDGTINIALNGYEYMVVAVKSYGCKVVTLKEKSFNNIDIFTKREMAIRGYGRK